MTLRSPKKHQTTQLSIEPCAQGIVAGFQFKESLQHFGVAFLATALMTGVVFAEQKPSKLPLAKTMSSLSKSANAESDIPGTPLSRWSKDSSVNASQPAASATASTPVIQQVSAQQEQVDFSEVAGLDLFEDRKSIQLFSFDELMTADLSSAQPGSGGQRTIPPPPSADLHETNGNGTSSSPYVPDEGDLVFQPITQITPSRMYSPNYELSRENKCPPYGAVNVPVGKFCPNVRGLPDQGEIDRHFQVTEYNWRASNLVHNPLYFEDVNLERYGYEYPPVIQDVVSIGRFGGQLIALPYQMALNPVHNCNYALGYYRPGDCPPFVEHKVPWNPKAAVTAAAAYTGIVFLVP